MFDLPQRYVYYRNLTIEQNLYPYLVNIYTLITVKTVLCHAAC